MNGTSQDPYDENYAPAADVSEPEADMLADSVLPESRDDMWAPVPEAEPVAEIPFEPVSNDESVRRSGLAWSAGIAFFGATAFMLFIGWLADWVLGSSPWGLVVGIVIGAAIGFFQFVRLTSQIFGSPSNKPEIKPLFSNHDDSE